MKKFVVLALAIVAVSCNGIIGNKYTITGEVAGLADGTKVFLEKQDDKTGMPVTVDTVKVEKGKFTFEGDAEDVVLHGVRFENIPNAGFALFVEKGDIKAKINKDSIGNAVVSGTYNNEELNKYIVENNKMQKKFIDFQQKNMEIYKAAEAKKDTVTLKKLNDQIMVFQKERVAYNTNYVEKNTKSMLTPILLQGFFSTPNPDLAKVKKYYEALDKSVKESVMGKKIATQIAEIEKNLNPTAAKK